MLKIGGIIYIFMIRLDAHAIKLICYEYIKNIWKRIVLKICFL